MSTPYEADHGFDVVKKRTVIGIDPGRDGGAVVLAPDGRTVFGAWRWRYSTKYYGQVARVLKLAEYAGQLYGPCLGSANQVLRPTAGSWRPMILGINPNTDSKTAEGAAIVACTRIKPPLVRGLGELGTDPHVAEAACIARYGWLMQRGPE